VTEARLPDRTEPAKVRLRAGIRRGLPFGLAVFLIAASYGVLARPVLGTVAPIVMSIVVFSGAAQLGSLAILGAGGGAGAAIVAGVLLNARYLAMGLALAPSLRGRVLSRAAFALTVVDASWAAASAGDGTFDPWFMVGVTVPQYPGWVIGTVLGCWPEARSATPRSSAWMRCSRPSSSPSCSRRCGGGASSRRPAGALGSRSP
jgi:predicted branched-subunit amino acid permease